MKRAESVRSGAEQQLTFGDYGHMLNNTQCFSPDDSWMVYDIRNDETQIGSTASIEVVNTRTGEIRTVYQTTNSSAFGPGVGAATFSPVRDRVLFIHGIRNADSSNPYSFTRRTGVAVDLSQPGSPIFMDARDVEYPFTPGALRGGTHAHTWSGDGEWISCTYNDLIIEQLSKDNSGFHDLRTVAVMAPLGRVVVSDANKSMENNSGEMFSAVVAEVKDHPVWGSDEIDKAFDECWIGKSGYQRQDGKWQKRAIAFQGNVYDKDGRVKTEVFVIDLPADISKARPGYPLEGTPTSRCNVPSGVVQRRITYTQKGIEGPRHWLRTTPDGRIIGFLAKDSSGIVQIFGVSPNGGPIQQLTFNQFSVSGRFNFSPDGRSLAYIADQTVYLTDISTKRSYPVSRKFNEADAPRGPVVWSNDGKALAYNRFVKNSRGTFLQIFRIRL